MQTAGRHFRTSATHFRLSGVINVIFRKTAITPLFFKLKTSSKTKLIPNVISNEPNHQKRYVPTRNGEKCLSKM